MTYFQTLYQLLMCINLPHCILNKIWIYFISLGTDTVKIIRPEIDMLTRIQRQRNTIETLFQFKIYLNGDRIESNEYKEHILELKISFLEKEVNLTPIKKEFKQIFINNLQKLVRHRLLYLDELLFTYQTPIAEIIKDEIEIIKYIKYSYKSPNNAISLFQHNIMLK